MNDPIELGHWLYGEFSNTIGYDSAPSYSLDNSVLSEASVLPVLNIHRNGIWGYNSWKQLRIGENSITRYHRRNNIISTNMDEVEKIIRTETDSGIIEEQVIILDPTPKFYFEPVFNPSNHPMELVLLAPERIFQRSQRGRGVRQNNISSRTTEVPLRYKIIYNNKIQFFANEKLNYYVTPKSPVDYNFMKLLYLNGGLSRNGYKFYHLKYKVWNFPNRRKCRL